MASSLHSGVKMKMEKIQYYKKLSIYIGDHNINRNVQKYQKFILGYITAAHSCPFLSNLTGHMVDHTGENN